MLKFIIKSNKLLFSLYLCLYKLFSRINMRIILFSFRKSKHIARLRNLKDVHSGQRCFIIGNGSSLKKEDLEKLKGEITFASHRIFRIFEQTDWRPTYYCAQDLALINDTIEQINKIETKLKFIPINAVWEYKIKCNNCVYFFINTQTFYPNLPNFSKNIDIQIYEGYTVTYALFQIASYMGFNEIYLLGVDFNYSASVDSEGRVIKNDNVKDYFSEGDNNEKPGLNLPNLQYSYLSYIKAKKIGEEKGIRIYNATRGGKLEIFERVNFDDIELNL